MFPISWHLPCIFDYDGPHGLGIPLTPALVLVQGCEGVLGPGCRGHYGYDDNAQADHPHVVEGVLCYVMLLCYVVVWCGANIVNTRVQFLLSDVTTLYLPVPVLKSYMSEIHAR